MIALLATLALGAPVEGKVLLRGRSTPQAGVAVRAVWDAPPEPGTERTFPAVTTDSEGRFALEAPEGARVTLSIDDPDYFPLEAVVTAPDPKVRLFVEPVDGEHEVVVEAFRETAHPTVHRLDAEQAYKTPGTQDDVIRLTQSLPGVTVQREFAPSSGDLSIRGSAPGDNRYYLDGIEIPYLYHFNQYASVFPTTWLRDLELMPSTFGARYGDAVGGVVEARSRADRPEDVQGQLTFNTIIAGADVRAPVGEETWVAVSGRRSYQDLYSRGSDQYTLWPVFHDLALRIEKGDEARGTGAFLVAAGDSYERAAGELDLLDPVEASRVPSFRFRRNFQVLGLRHRWRGPDGDGRLVVGLVHDDLLGRLEGIGTQRQRTVQLTSRLDAGQRFGGQDQHRWNAGWEIRGTLGLLDVDGGGPKAIVVATEAPALARGAALDATLPRLEAAAYGEALLRFGRIHLIPGLRLGVDSRTGGFLPGPRLAARWRVADQTRLELAGGHYRQTPQLLDLAPAIGDPQLPLTRSWQISAGWDQTIADRLEITLDAYAKDLRDAQVARPDAPPEVLDRGRVLGVELVTRYRLRERFFLWGWAGVMRSQVRREGSWAPAAFDQPVNVGAVLSWDPSTRWNLAVRWRYGSGLPWTPVVGSVYDASIDTWDPVPGTPFSERFPAYTKLDLAARYTFVFDRWTLALRAEVWYVPPAANVLYPTWNDDWTEQGFVRGIPVLPLLGARATF